MCAAKPINEDDGSPLKSKVSQIVFVVILVIKHFCLYFELHDSIDGHGITWRQGILVFRHLKFLHV